MDMRSAYLDTEIMLVVKSKEVNEQLAANMKKYDIYSKIFGVVQIFVLNKGGI